MNVTENAKSIFVRFSVAFSIFLVFYIYPTLGWASFRGVLFPIIGTFIFLFEIRKIVLFLLKRETVKVKRFELRKLLFNKVNLLFLIFLFVLFFSPYYVTYITSYASKSNVLQTKALAESIVQNYSSDGDKARVLYEWFLPQNGNMYNIYGKYLILELYPTDIYFPPYLCIRLEGHEDPYWILTSRCGSCSEYSLFFRELSNYANLTVRSIHDSGEDHNWDEVLINNSWVIIDPSWPLYNVSPRFYEVNRSLNMSYVYAEYSNGTREDVTYRYTTLSNLTLTALDVHGNIIPNVTMSLYSNNYRPEMDTELNCTTDNYGKCLFSIGSGKHTLKSIREDGMLYNKTNFEIEENTSKNMSIILNFDFLDAPLDKILSFVINTITSITFVILVWILIVIYMNF